MVDERSDEWDSSITPSNTPAEFAQVGRRQGITQQTLQNTQKSVGALRTELTGRINRLDNRVDGLTAQSSLVSGKMDVLTDVVKRSLDEQSKIHISLATASIEVEKTGELALIEDRMAVRRHRRIVFLKVLAGAAGLWGTVSAFLLARGCS